MGLQPSEAVRDEWQGASVTPGAGRPHGVEHGAEARSLPRFKAGVTAQEAFGGTFHVPV